MSGYYTNNQIENDSISWIQVGLWLLVVYNSTSSSFSSPFVNSSNSINCAKAIFSANLTMIKPDGTQTHEHSVTNITSNSIIITGSDMIITELEISMRMPH